ncbi:minor capsid protein [Oceanobacillus sojae]|uniref:minor capsid protein n=1 Tax=Oceanobacillus sojae TaxID=582851 RepID=UPI0021A96A97|nr:minor capsid protein [Oceanobacillus sojae]MCT1904117.1 minor capsid protein [Oceanobacillus sojae]
MDFLERLTDAVNSIDGLPIRCEPGYLKTDESFVVYPIPGSRVTQEFHDGTKDQQLNYEFAMKSKIPGNIHNTLWVVQNALEEIENIESNNGSFKFDELIITNKPFINQSDSQGWFVFLLDIQAKITTFKNKESERIG